MMLFAPLRTAAEARADELEPGAILSDEQIEALLARDAYEHDTMPWPQPPIIRTRPTLTERIGRWWREWIIGDMP